MQQNMRIVMAQLNLHVGDIERNTQSLIEAAHQARDQLGAHLIVYPELSLCGYPSEDLLLRPSMQVRIERALARLSEEVTGIGMLVGYPWCIGTERFNTCTLLHDGRILGRYYKNKLPNYQVFDEQRYFTPGVDTTVVAFQGIRIGLGICEDLWHPEPIAKARAAGAELFVSLHASPFHLGKDSARATVLRQRAQEAAMPIVYVNQVGGQDELVFDGGSFVVDAAGDPVQRAPSFVAGLYPVDLAHTEKGCRVVPSNIAPFLSEEVALYEALVLGVRDYVQKNAFKGVLLGLSGGIDSALTLAIAVDALGSAAVTAMMMPYQYTAAMSVADARAQAEFLGVRYQEVSIAPMVEAFMGALAPLFNGLATDTTEENIQARCRGVLLMALSNKTGALVLTTGNKSELSVGYATLYGDMAGGFDVLKDVSKTRVFALARYRNSLHPVIPQRVIDRPPSAELAPDQKDEDSLPPYAILDALLHGYIEQDLSVQALINQGFAAETVRRVVSLVDCNEYKRRQAAIGVRVTERAFGRDRRYPITNGWSLGD